MPELLQAITDLLGEDMVEPQITLEPRQGKFRARLYEEGVVHQESIDEGGNIHLSLRLPKADFIRFMKEESMDPYPCLEPLETVVEEEPAKKATKKATKLTPPKAAVS